MALNPADNAFEAIVRRASIKAATPSMIMDEISPVIPYADKISKTVKNTLVTIGNDLEAYKHLTIAINDLLTDFKACHERGNKVILVGNGGSSAICSHMAVDFSKNAGIRAVSFNDFPTLTCLSNDYGYEQVFAKQIEYHATKEDCLVCISTGGKSPNILNAIKAFPGKRTYTFTGMKPDNPLRSMGSLNFFSPSRDYGIVEIAHLTLLHSLSPCLG